LVNAPGTMIESLDAPTRELTRITDCHRIHSAFAAK